MELRVAMEAKELIGGRIVFVIGAGLFVALEWRAEPGGAEAGAAPFLGAVVGEVAGAVVGAVVGAG